MTCSVQKAPLRIRSAAVNLGIWQTMAVIMAKPSEVLLNATRQCDAPLTFERLCGWQASLFPTGFSGPNRIRTGELGAQNNQQGSKLWPA